MTGRNVQVQNIRDVTSMSKKSGGGAKCPSLKRPVPECPGAKRPSPKSPGAKRSGPKSPG